jgi:hypothetical protein
MLAHLQPLIRKLVILLLEALVIGALIAFAFFLNSTPTSPPPATEQPKSAPIALAKPSLTQDHATTVLELFNPSDQSLTHQLNETAVTQQIEQIMATSYVLSRCQLMDDAAYRDNFRALIIFAQKNNLAPDAMSAEAKLRQIAESASTSYQLLYRRTTCDNARLPFIAQQLHDWQNAYLNQ